MVHLIIDFLKQVIAREKIPHAYLFVGVPGIGKTTAAIALAQILNCENPDNGEGCGRCRSCRQIKSGNFPELVFIEAEGRYIKIEQIRDLDHVLGFKPLVGKYRVSVIRQAETMTEEAANACLKTLEEPPPGNMLVLTVTDPRDLLPTIVSRCQKVAFRPIPAHLIKKWLVAEKRLSEGDARAAINDIHSFSNEVGLVDDMRDKKESILKALMKVLKTVDVDVALRAFDRIDVDFDECILWLDENLPREYKDAESLAKAYDILSKVDVLRGRILRRQHWGFLGYMYNLATAGVALSKKQKLVGYVKYQRNDRILKMWIARRANSKLEEVLRKIAEKTHSSVNKVRKDFRFYIKILQDKSVAKWIGLSDDESSLIFSK